MHYLDNKVFEGRWSIWISLFRKRRIIFTGWANIIFRRTVIEGDGRRQPIEVVQQIGKLWGLCAAEWHMTPQIWRAVVNTAMKLQDLMTLNLWSCWATSGLRNGSVLFGVRCPSHHFIGLYIASHLIQSGQISEGWEVNAVAPSVISYVYGQSPLKQ